MTIIFVLIVVGLGLRAMTTLPIDAVPTSPQRGAIVTKAPGLAHRKWKKFITFPVEVSMRGLPGITRFARSPHSACPRYGSIFSESYDIYFARRLVMERLPAARELIPAGYGSPEMLPVSTALGEISSFRSLIPSARDGARSILDWEISPQLNRFRAWSKSTASAGAQNL